MQFITQKYPDIGPAIDKFVEDCNVGADAWRQMGILTYNGNRKVKKRLHTTESSRNFLTAILLVDLLDALLLKELLLFFTAVRCSLMYRSGLSDCEYVILLSILFCYAHRNAALHHS